MQGFEVMLKAMGVDPQKMVDQAMERFGPELAQFKDKVVETIKVEVIAPMAEAFASKLDNANSDMLSALVQKLDSLDDAIKGLNPDYVPVAFRQGQMVVNPDLAQPEPVTNADLPQGGAVDPATLDPERMANQGSLADQAALAPAALNVVEDPAADENVPDPFAGVREVDTATGSV